MKKVIAAAAGLLLTGALVTTASAAVSFSGDARYRGYYEKDYDLGVLTPDPVTGIPSRTFEKQFDQNSRFRVKVDADAAGGAYVRSRIRIGNGRHGVPGGSKTDVSTDYMEVGVPIGPVTIEGGRMRANLTKFFLWDARNDQIIAKWSNDMTGLQFWYQKVLESQNNIDDNDIVGYYGLWTQKFAGDWNMVVAGAYFDDQTPADLSG